MLLIDAFNVLHVTGVLPPHLAGLDVHGLIRLIGISRYARRKVLLVCDGVAPRAHSTLAHDPRITYAGGRLKADDIIRDRLATLPRSQNILLISSDRELVRDARKRRFDTRSSDMFLRHLAHDEAQPAHASARPARPPFAYEVPLDRASQELWERLLGVPSSGRERQSAAQNLPPHAPVPAPASAPADPLLDADAIAEIESRLRQLLAHRHRPGVSAPAPTRIEHPRPKRSPGRPPSPKPAGQVAPAAPSTIDPALLALLKDLSPDLALADIDMDAVLRRRPPEGPRR